MCYILYMNEYKVYVHIAPNNKKYVGITKSKNPHSRWGNHGTGYKNQVLFWRAIQKYGWENFRHIILLDNLTKEKACEYEKYFINKYRSNDSNFGYNLTNGGDGIDGYKFSDEQRKQRSIKMTGHVVSQETKEKIGRANSVALKGKILPDNVKQKISIALSGENHPMYGKHQPKDAVDRMREKQLGNTYHLGCKATDEQRQRMSDAHKGLPLTESQKENLKKIHESNKGKPRSEETKQKIRAAHLGKKRGPWTDAERKAHMDAIKRRKENTTNI